MSGGSPTPKRRRLVSPKKKTPRNTSAAADVSTPSSSRSVNRSNIIPVELTKEQKIEMEEVFNIFDIDKNGSINGYELKIALRALGFNASNEECNNIMARYNKKKGHPFDALNQEEFFLIIGEQIALKNPEDEIREAFELFDTEDKGSITVKNLQNALVQLERGNEKTEEELQAEIARWDKDGDGQLNYEEFRAIMLNQEAI